MARKRKASRLPSAPAGPREVDPADARLGPINTWEDVADSEDEFYINQDKIMLEDEPLSKRRKQQQREEEFLEASDEEVLRHKDAYSDEDEDEDEDEEEEEEEKKQVKPAARSKKVSRKKDDSDEEQDNGEPEEDGGWWGSAKTDYYNADQIETEADALEEEAEARRLQQKKLSKMSEADFIFDQDAWAAPADQAAEEEDVVTEVLKDLEVTDAMGPEERYKLLQGRYPEFSYLVDEFQTLQPELLNIQKEAEGKPSRSLEVIKYWVLGSYVAALACYFAILTSPARDGAGDTKPLDPVKLRDHEIMSTLVSCREAWAKVKNLKATGSVVGVSDLSPLPEEDIDMLHEAQAIKAPKRSKAALANGDAAARKKRKAAEKEKLARAKDIEASIADLAGLLSKSKKTSRTREKASTAAAGPGDDNSDFGEEDMLDARASAAKAARKKSLRFYTSQIVQKANRRADAGRDAGGDVDIPYRERLKDRQARLMAEAEKRGQKGSKFGADLGDDASDDEDRAVANGVRDDEDGYYDMVVHASKAKKADKAAMQAALAQASAQDRIVEVEEIGEDGKRAISYQIEKNKGLMRKKKGSQNPRVKKRKKYEEKQKKLRSMKPVYKGGEGRGGYQGEQSGIKTGLVKSVKL